MAGLGDRVLQPGQGGQLVGDALQRGEGRTGVAAFAPAGGGLQVATQAGERGVGRGGGEHVEGGGGAAGPQVIGGGGDRGGLDFVTKGFDGGGRGKLREALQGGGHRGEVVSLQGGAGTLEVRLAFELAEVEVVQQAAVGRVVVVGECVAGGGGVAAVGEASGPGEAVGGALGVALGVVVAGGDPFPQVGGVGGAGFQGVGGPGVAAGVVDPVGLEVVVAAFHEAFAEFGDGFLGAALRAQGGVGEQLGRLVEAAGIQGGEGVVEVGGGHRKSAKVGLFESGLRPDGKLLETRKRRRCGFWEGEAPAEPHVAGTLRLGREPRPPKSASTG